MDKTKTKTVSQLTESSYIDNDTGELKRKEDVKMHRFESEPEYVKMYVDDILKLNDLPTSSNNVVRSILKRMNYDNQVVLVRAIKDQIADECKISNNTVEKRIIDLKKKNVLIPYDKEKNRRSSVYIVNPNYFAKGKWENIKKIRVQITYSETEGRIIKTDYDKQTSLFEFDESYKMKNKNLSYYEEAK